MLKDNKVVQIGRVTVSGAVALTSTIMVGKVVDILVPAPYKGIAKVFVRIGKAGIEAGLAKAVYDATAETYDSVFEIIDATAEAVKAQPTETVGEGA